MIRKNGLTFSKSNNDKKSSKSLLLFIISIIILCLLSLYELLDYKLLIRDFSSNFDNNEFSTANGLLIEKSNLNPFKYFFLKKDISKYFSDKLDNISKEIEDEQFNDESALNIVNEIKRYNTFIDTSIINNELLNNSQTFENAVSLFDNGKYIRAYDIFSSIKSNDSNYSSSIEYMRRCKNYIISDALTRTSDFSDSGNYDTALNLLDSIRPIVGDDESIVSKVEEIKTYQTYNNDEYKSEAASSSVALINTTNINSLSLESITPYLVHVDLTNQKTNIYKGKNNKWNLIKSFSCSSGIEGENTPKGNYTVKEKGSWFFSNTYKQGAKYWVQFYGNYLFHSLPYNEDKSKIVDFTLGKPASHGCIRLGETDSKWLYDNIPKGTKVIIQ